MKPQLRYQPGNRIGGRYQVRKALMGGMGEIYLYLDLTEMRPYTIRHSQSCSLINGPASVEACVSRWKGANTMNPNFYASGARIGGRYEVAGRPLVGGMGVVYLCFDHQEQRPVALKTFKPEFLPDRAARERFLREGATWVALGRHPHIVHAYGVERIGDGREVYLVLELVAKEQGRMDASLRSYLIPGRPLSVAQALGFAVQIARGMLHASATLDGFVHRDLKPENVLVGADRLMGSDLNRVRVTDFGLVRAATVGQAGAASEITPMPGARAGLTQVGGVLGTPPYMAPEQWTGDDVDARADIYALGCILGEMLIGKELVQATALAGYRQGHQAGEALKAVQGLPLEVRAVLVRCLVVDLGARYATWGEVLQALTGLYYQETGKKMTESGNIVILSLVERAGVGWSHNAIGLSYLDLGQAERALWFFTQAQQVGQAERDRTLEGTGLGNLGSAYTALGEPRRAIGYHERTLTISQETGDRHGEGTALGNLGNAYTALGDSRRAIDYFEQALTIYREINDRRGESKVIGNLGVAYNNQGDTRHAIDYYEQSLAIDREIGNYRGEGANLSNLGRAYADLGDLHRAISYFKQALIIRQEIGDRRGEGSDLGNLGVSYKNLGDVHRAINYHEHALTISREIGDRMGEGIDLGNLGEVHQQLGDAPQAIEYHEQALAIAREIGDRTGEGLILGNLGNSYLYLGDARRAVGYYEQALVIRREIGDRMGEGINLIGLGNANFHLGDARLSISYYQQALTITYGIGDLMSVGNALGNLGSAYLHLGDIDRAISYYEQALTIHRKIGDVNNVAIFSFNMARLHAEQGDPKRALPLIREAARLFTEIGHAANAERARQLVAQLERHGG